MIQPGSLLWQYLSITQRQLALDGQLLLADRKNHPNEELSDYSYLVFPFAKLYEGFLKQLFRDLEVISEREYESPHFRLGKVLSPNLIRRLGAKSAYGTVTKRYGAQLSDMLWNTWKQGRNLVFHYFPHNVRRLSLEEATNIIHMIVDSMSEAVNITRPRKKKSKVVLATSAKSGVSYI